ncbi:MAG: 23S rRNA (guanosine(2251)-2'-O)-methyltransferase RlmB [Myxococcales bacterium]|nr:23S rRNA (guanosine(2251)-2'-O)-methyltransferase RlmB [Myxococcales bacterium]
MSRVVAGRRAVLEALRSGRPQRLILASDARRNLREILQLARERGVPTEERSIDELDQLSPGIRHQGVIAQVDEARYLSLHELLEPCTRPPLFVALDEITDPHNLGAIVRSVVAFGADGIILPKHRAAHVTPVVTRTSAGGTEYARFAEVTNLQKALTELAERGFQVVGLAADGGTKLSELPPAPEGRVLVIGSEGRGLRRLVRSRCDVLARIDLPGPIASLNAAVAAGIALFEASKDRPPAGPSEPPSA